MIKNGLRSIFVSLLSVFSLHSFAENVTDVSAAQLLQADKQDWLILDVRTPQEYAAGHVPNAINIPHTEIAENIDRLKDFKNKPIVLYCRSGNRVVTATEIMIENGFSKIHHLQGDMLGWVKSGYKIEK